MTIASRARWLAVTALVVLCAGHGSPVSAQAVAPTPEQLEMLQSLPPEERQVLIDKAKEGLAGTAPLMGVGDKVESRAPDREQKRAVVEAPPEAPRTVSDLRPFGYDIFRRQGSDFEPEAAIPVPNDYVLGPGDRLEVQLYGNERGNYVLIVGRDGQVRFPKLGPVSVGGMRFEDVRGVISERISRQFVGTEVSLSMGELRSIRVFVLGDVERPGSYLVSALSTVSNALLAAGGISTVGSLRGVQLKRAGNVVGRLDLYDLLLNGDTSKDSRLLAGDVVFVPPVGPTVSVFGEVNRPAIYEVRTGAEIGDLISLSGGLKPKADPNYARLERLASTRDRVTIDIDLTSVTDRRRPLQSGDLLVVSGIRSTLQRSVELTGAVLRPKMFEYTDALRLSDLIPTLNDLEDSADASYVLVRREPVPGQVEFLSADLQAALKAKKSGEDVQLQPRDRVIVLPRPEGPGREARESALKPLIAELRAVATLDAPVRVVTLAGVVRGPGDYPLEPGMKITDLLRAGSQLADAAYAQNAELARYTVIDGQQRQTDVTAVDLGALLRGDPAANLTLRPYDVLTIKQVPQWNDTDSVMLSGEVRFPGAYPIRRGETLKSVIARAGGVLPGAFVEGSVFTRAFLRDLEREQLDSLAARLRGDLAALSVSLTQSPDKTGEERQAFMAGQGLLSQLQSAKPVGRLVVNLADQLSGSATDIILRSGDALHIPRQSQSVAVLGEVQSPTSHLWRKELTRNDYLGLSGGLTGRADSDRIYVVRADGSVVTRKGGFFGGAPEVHTGDSIIVPMDAERMRPLALWTAVTTVIYNLAVATAAIGSL